MNALVVMFRNCPSRTLNETLVPVTSPVFDKTTLKLNLSKCAFGYFFINSSFNCFFCYLKVIQCLVVIFTIVLPVRFFVLFKVLFERHLYLIPLISFIGTHDRLSYPNHFTNAIPFFFLSIFSTLYVSSFLFTTDFSSS